MSLFLPRLNGRKKSRKEVLFQIISKNLVCFMRDCAVVAFLVVELKIKF